MSIAETIMVACLVLTGAVCTLGIFSRHFDDTVLQRIGMATLAVACFSRASVRWVYEVQDPSPEVLVGQIGLCLFAVGSALKVWRRAHRGHRRRGVPL